MNMTQEQAVAVVAYLNRAGLIQAMEGQAAVWRDALHGVRYEDAIEACRALARRAGVVQVKPGDLLLEAHLIRKARIGNRVPPAPPVELSPERDAVFGRVYLRALGDGATEADADAAACAATNTVRGPVAAVSGSGKLRELLEAAAASMALPGGADG